MFRKFCISIILILATTQLLYAEIRQNAWSAPPEGRLKKSFFDTVKNPRFYLTVSAGIIALAALDGEVSRYASRENPIFGSGENADNISDILTISIVPLMFYTAFQTEPEKDENGRTIGNKFSRIALMTAILAVDYVTTSVLKRTSNRLRPDDSDTLSLPSGHSSISASLSTIINKNVDNSRFSGTTWGSVIKIGTISFASLTAWARVEASKHHLSDVLLGHSLGFLVSDFLYNTFLEKKVEKEDVLTNYFYIHPEKFEMGLSYRF